MKLPLQQLLIICITGLCIFSCKQSDPPEPVQTGDLFFSGYWWNIKNSNGNAVGPGPNIFSNSSDNIWVDKDGMMHLKIRYNNGKWYCSELISVKTTGYGTYIFTTANDMTTMNERVVLGLFTWNTYSFQTQANSEIDIELARWNVASDSLLVTYSVQPVWFDNATPFIERTRKPSMQFSKLKSSCTHALNWTPAKITWESYAGEVYPGTDLLCSWSYDNTNPARSKQEGGKTSNPVVIPAPEDSTHARINLWLLTGLPPSDGKDFEVVVKSFKYIPLTDESFTNSLNKSPIKNP